MERSEEIGRVVRRWLTAIRAGDADAVMARVSELPGSLLIGTDRNEWWEGDGRLVFRRQLEESRGFPLSWDEIDAWEEASCGWASAKVRLEWGGVSYDARMTFVLHLERDDWKIVQAHQSLPTANESIGMTLTTSLGELDQMMQRMQPDLSGSMAVDGTVTIVFTDIVDSTLMLGRVGDAAWVDVIRRHNDVLTVVTESHGGTVVETQGDGSMLAFSSARRAVMCALAIQQEIGRVFADFSPPIRVRIGLHTGDAIREADRFFGTTVHFAARIAALAIGGEVLVSSVVRDLVAGGAPDVSFVESREVELKGLEGSHRLYSLASR